MPAKKKADRCWRGYEPVPGKQQHEQGSCRKKPASNSSASEKAFQKKRENQLDEWQAEHKGSRRSAAQHLPAPDKKKTTARKRTAAKKRSAAKTK